MIPYTTNCTEYYPLTSRKVPLIFLIEAHVVERKHVRALDTNKVTKKFKIISCTMDAANNTLHKMLYKEIDIKIYNIHKYGLVISGSSSTLHIFYSCMSDIVMNICV
jgi:hypothetical protein